MILDKKSDVGYDKKYIRKGQMMEGVSENPHKEDTEDRVGVEGGGGYGLGLGRNCHRGRG